MNEILSRLHENRQIELAKSILESKGYKVEKKLKESSVENALDKLISMSSEELLSYRDYPEMYDFMGDEILAQVTEFLGCDVEDLCSLAGRDEDSAESEYQELVDYIYDNSHHVGREISLGYLDGYLQPTIMDDTSGKYVFYLDGDSSPNIIVAVK